MLLEVRFFALLHERVGRVEQVLCVWWVRHLRAKPPQGRAEIVRVMLRYYSLLEHLQRYSTVQCKGS